MKNSNNKINSIYLNFNRKSWSLKRGNMKIYLSEDDIKSVLSLNDKINLAEVNDFYMPITRLIEYYINANTELYNIRNKFLGSGIYKVPYIIGVTGSVAVGKSTTSRLLKILLERSGYNNVNIVSTDNFLKPNKILAKENLMMRKGFPESYDMVNLMNFLISIKSGKSMLKIPVYSHIKYDIEDNFICINKPDILILEGLNILQINKTYSRVYISDLIDFSIFVDSKEEYIKNWFIERFLLLKKNSFKDPESYFKKYYYISDEEAKKVAEDIWDKINGLNYHNNIIKTKYRSNLIIVKGKNHSIQRILMRKL